jgi:hypothetical protein
MSQSRKFEKADLLKRRAKYVFANPMSPTSQDTESSDRGLKNRLLATELSVRSKLPIVNY